MARRAQRLKTLKLFLPLCPSRLRSGLCSFLFLCVLCGKLSICFLISPSYAVENQDNPSSNSLNSYIEQFYEYKYKTANEVTAQSLLQQRAIPLTLLPRDKYDLIDWAGAVRSGIISPLSSIDGLQEDDDPIDLLIPIKAKNEFMTDVIFPQVFCFLLLILISCTGMKIEKEEVSEGTLVIYLYLPNSNQQDINFTIEKIEIKQRDGGWIKLSEKPFVIRSLDIAKDQVLLTESNIMEGENDRVMIRISNASVRRNEKFHTLALPQPNGEVELKGDIISIGSSESRAIFLT